MNEVMELILVVAAGVYLFSCVQVARRMGRVGRGRARWFFVTLVATAIPAFVVLYREYQGEVERGASSDGASGGGTSPPRPPRGICPHCQQPVGQGEQEHGVSTCPHCGLRTKTERYA